MRQSLSLGRRGLGRVWPNPNVGCVIVRNGRVIGRGWTADGGRPHAETRALDGIDARGATAYVTLEPCAHHGRTPPCAEALIAAGVSRVVIATGDPDPRVAGRGIAMLEAAGIEVTRGVCEAEARHDLQGFLLHVTQARPFVTLKLAGSFDGRIATATGESQWITGPSARRAVHAMRARHDAVLVGAGTVRADDPSLTVRDLGIDRQPVRIVASGRLNIDGSALLRSIPQAPLWLCHGPDAPAQDWAATGATLIPCEMQGRQVDPVDMMAKLAERGLTRIFCEGGGTLAASLLNAGLVDELVGFTAGVLVGAEGTPSLGALGVERLSEAPRFQLAEVTPVGRDILHRWRRLPA
ncbi:bifunctional diaminohydroxyphosphoribosylaminopyrimidine deaminase/5-amino-6-(5-phosphoribosylamino)uracil reductase RibD [Thalassorhabdomicrobium marinisediminis]|uniref:bifunctional diaminohydroxyphosphoribosylaminopyrimidine deaminase/5-amino-6-(5-phosphoribosylamino)uracil reductase RibD n=1 Tax=Thalassorhabdomicrobium marinisediminis TaxID=2170577 RepID=UPI002492EF9D|nr:bifunctional diaminohydroxyphosphoribosylaminopyrimidine deaminase/5-amino-6-(5-phosphoribosylamino)uracil reductase RibD [Thalassorhabdomicrobium marinisediminis]